jgi:thiol-disulfide isomerase/thioredoxin
MKKQLLLVLVALATSLSLKAQMNNVSVGQDAPNFTVTDIHGQTHTLSNYIGKYVVIDFFAYWCGPCQTISPVVNSFYKKYGCNGYDVIVLALEGDGTLAQTENYENLYGGDANFPTPSISGLDGGGSAVHDTYGPAAYPTIILIGPDGKIKNTDIWPISGVSTFENAIIAAGGSAVLVEHTCELANLNEMTISEVSVYPNPSAGNFNIEFSAETNQTASIEVFNLIGAKVWSSTSPTNAGTNSIAISLGDVQKGSYLIKVRSGESEVIKTIQVQ